MGKLLLLLMITNVFSLITKVRLVRRGKLLLLLMITMLSLITKVRLVKGNLLLVLMTQITKV